MLHLLIQCIPENILRRVERDTFSHFPPWQVLYVQIFYTRQDRSVDNEDSSIDCFCVIHNWKFICCGQHNSEGQAKHSLNLRKIITLPVSKFLFLWYHYTFPVLHNCSRPFWHSRNSWHSRNARHTRPSRSQLCKRRTRRDWSEGRSWCPGLFKLETMCLARGRWPGFWND